jgi:hypothetical protein
MTREEAIIVLKAFMENPLFSDVHKAAFNIAIHDIKAHHDWDINNLILINKDNYEPLEQEPQTFKWCTDCKEYDQEKHCCHRWSKVIRDTVEEMKQEYIEREVLDKIRAEIEKLQKMCDKNDLNLMAQYSAFGMVLDIIDKYMAETEEEDSAAKDSVGFVSNMEW